MAKARALIQKEAAAVAAIDELVSDISRWENEGAAARALPSLLSAIEALITAQSAARGETDFWSRERSPAAITAFSRWLQERGCEDLGGSGRLELRDAGDDRGLGVFATRDIAAEERLLAVPIPCAMTIETAHECTFLKPILEGAGRYLEQIPVVLLSLHLLVEAAQSDSKWGPYIAMLPAHVPNVLAFGTAEFNALAGAPVWLRCAKFLRNTAKHYAVLYNQLVGSRTVPTFGKIFTWVNFRVATMNVMARQNSVPAPHGARGSGLVPLFDMFNHVDGPMTSYFDDADTRACVDARRAFAKGEEVTMSYGTRGNNEYVQFQGFFVPGCVTSVAEFIITFDPARDELARVRRAAFRGESAETGSPDEFIAKVGQDGVPSAGLMRFARLAGMDKSGLATALRRPVGAEIDASGAEEARALLFAASLCNSEVRRLRELRGPRAACLAHVASLAEEGEFILERGAAWMRRQAERVTDVGSGSSTACDAPIAPVSAVDAPLELATAATPPLPPAGEATVSGTA